MEIVWSTSQGLESEYLEIRINEGLGVLVVQENREFPPVLVVCSLFSDPAKTYYEGLDRKSSGVTLNDMREILDTIEKKLQKRPFQ